MDLNIHFSLQKYEKKGKEKQNKSQNATECVSE